MAGGAIAATAANPSDRGCVRTSSTNGTLLTSSVSFTRANSGASVNFTRVTRPTTTSTMLMRNGMRQP
jgi:hypothetical protein